MVFCMLEIIAVVLFIAFIYNLDKVLSFFVTWLVIIPLIILSNIWDFITGKNK